MAKRNFPLDILVLLLPCFLMTDALAASSLKLSKPNCADHCGNITIPYPFGMDKTECFFEAWYEIDCRNGTTPFLKKFDLEVLNISLPTYRRDGPAGSVTDMADYDKPSLIVDFPIIYSNYIDCSTNVTRTKEPPDLKGSPFFFSSEGNNVFTAVGRCNVIAMMTTSSVGCKINCGGGDYPGTCQSTAIPRALQTFDVNFTDIYPSNATRINATQCNDYAFLNSQSSHLDSVQKEGHAPVMLEWGVSAFGGLDYDPNSSGMPWLDNSGMIQIHICNPGYEGDPYLSDGCQDINECEDPKNRCPKRCVNKQGSYDCVDPYRTLKLVMSGIGSSLGSLLLVLLGWQLYRIIKERNEKKLREKYFKQNGGILLQQQLLSPEGNLQKGKLFDENELQKATENFCESRVLGKGGQGTVYKGMLTNGRIVAIKKALDIDKGNVEQFINEVMILSQINHRNIVKLLGCCLETKIPLLVYEFIPNGNLYEYLHKSNNECLVSWEVRLQLAIEIAGALFYLHSAASMPIYHRDIKSTNILLDEKYRAKIADFGTSRSVTLDQTHVTTIIQGTFGYLDPEFFQTLQFTDKSDVYSFGVVLIELLTGQKPITTTGIEECRNLAIHFVLSMEDGHLFDILDAQVLNQAAKEEILIVANLAKRCLHSSGKNRPTMKEVTVELEEIRKLRHLPNIKESEEEHMLVQCQDIFGSASSRLNINIDDTTSSDVQHLLHGRT